MPTSMATALLSPSRPYLCSLCFFWLLTSLQGSFPLAVHAYHRPPTSTERKDIWVLLQRSFADSKFVDNVHILYTPHSYTSAAVLRDISVETSYQTVRLVFRPYIHLRPSNWTSEWLWSSISLSPDFNLDRCSSLSFGSYPCNSSISLGV